ncbi:hypothetical protein P175DRAFT_0473233 [Aspergillus ochraceoroseus IBT 24754]|uniref:Type 1 phosphatases regulator n=3 Tax=Aspergillus subgen. Nidulantes TaxID=2720870 RepID=A0A0F8XLE3_9EURO|nr:uncharacterized protein P175DRAFT_0473233 [Aspergillus ochraceoroseus IBT 24754]KKK20010.1 hypothetical protein AOCH_005362 [Aspergillus ochraceoroseus]KKK24397.1 hypothetical protein ARAM_004384 [Aspergillus rambellii]PTU22367.1 hypothetical protein P175DRAFT_0473233 [Aspergillus ochraceoroseus IBT 24754]
MSHNRQALPQASTPNSRVSSVTRVEERPRISGTLRLRAEDAPPPPVSQDEAPSRRIRWSEDVIDNEGMGKKSSKVCCIYHKARPVGESSSEESSSSSSDSDSDSDSHSDRPTSRRKCQHAHNQNGEHPHDSSQGSPERGRVVEGCSRNHETRKTKRRKPSPNAYEKMPKNK